MTAAPAGSPAPIQVYIINGCQDLSASDLLPIQTALRNQLRRDFAPAWGIDADLHLLINATVADLGNVPASAWPIYLQPGNGPGGGTLADHTATLAGSPRGYVYPDALKAANMPLSIGIGHELLEMLVDPQVNRATLVQDASGKRTLYSYECCDPVESGRYLSPNGKVWLTNFVFPAWFDIYATGVQFDQMKTVTAPFTLAPGGYVSTLDVATAGSPWTQTFADAPALVTGRAAMIMPGSRRDRRMNHA